MTAAESPDELMTYPLAQPGAIPDRETVEGWSKWRLTRNDFVPAPSLTLSRYKTLGPRERQLYDLHRTATHVNLPLLETPMSAKLTRFMRRRLVNNALKQSPVSRPGLMITGGGYQGKTETACEIAAAFEDDWVNLCTRLGIEHRAGTRDIHAPVAYVQTPVTATPKSLCQAILDFYGADYKTMGLARLTRLVRVSLHDHGTLVLLLDDITRLKMHRASDQDTLDLIRALMDMHTTLVLIGVDIPGSGLLNGAVYDDHTGQWTFPPARNNLGDDLSTQTQHRFDLLHLEPFQDRLDHQIGAWITHLRGVERHLRLLKAKPGMLSAGNMPDYLFERTGGVLGFLGRLIEDACAEAIESGAEQLTEKLLETIEINTANDVNRDKDAGEIPPIPPNAPSRRTKPKHFRNTVFDDHGEASRRTQEASRRTQRE